MPDREKLAAILRKTEINKINGHSVLAEVCFTQNVFERMADHLLANGVVVLPVQVGDTVYGRFHHYGKEVQECKVVKSKICQFASGVTRYFLDVEFDIIDPFYRDGRLMRCGCQAVYGADFGDWYRVYLTREEVPTAEQT